MSDPSDLPAIAPGARLVHIGVPKTGTTAIQQTAATRRAALLDAGVLYPGTGVNHVTEAAAFLQREWGWGATEQKIPPRDAWLRLRDEIAADAHRRVWVSHEFLAEADDEQAAELVAELGGSPHIVVGFRNLGELLPSTWQQYIKGSSAYTFDQWLGIMLRPVPNPVVTPRFHLRADHTGIIDRWVGLVGPENVTVMIPRRDTPELVPRTFEALLDLPPGLLALTATDRRSVNRSLTGEEVEFLRAFNRIFHDNQPTNRADHYRLFRKGALERLLDLPADGTEFSRTTLPAWAADIAHERGNSHADAIAASGARIVGDLDDLRRRMPSRDEAYVAPTHVPIEVASQAMAGMYSAAVRRGPNFAPEAKPTPEQRAVERRMAALRSSDRATRRTAARAQARPIATGDLLALVGRRLLAKLGLAKKRGS